MVSEYTKRTAELFLLVLVISVIVPLAEVFIFRPFLPVTASKVEALYIGIIAGLVAAFIARNLWK